jgi:tetratricopeptide (TPR) repeat protein
MMSGEPAASATDPWTHCGVLHKRGHMNTAFKRRFFVLRGTRLSYYEDRAAAEKRGRSRGVVTVVKVRHMRPGEGEGMEDDGLPPSRLPFAFHFETAERKPFVVYAESMQEKLDWLGAMLAAIRAATQSGSGSPLASPIERAAHRRTPSGGGSPRPASASRHRRTPSGGAGGSVGGGASTASLSGGLPAAGSTPWFVIEDLYREHVAAVEAVDADEEEAAQSLERSLEEPLAWRHIVAGVEHARSSRTIDAQTSFGEALAASGYKERGCREPVALAALHESAKLHCSLREYGKATAQFEAALAIAPSEAVAPLKLQCAWCYAQLGRDEKAEALYMEVLEDNPVHRAALLDRARMQLRLGKWNEALMSLDLVIALGDCTPDVLNDHGVAYHELGEHQSALSALNDAIDADSSFAPALINRGSVHASLGDLDASFRDLHRAIAIDPGSAKALNNRGALNLLCERFDAAVEDFEQAKVQAELLCAQDELRPADELDAASRNLAFALQKQGSSRASHEQQLRQQQLLQQGIESLGMEPGAEEAFMVRVSVDSSDD